MYRQATGTRPVLPVLSFWPGIQFSEANSPCFLVRISKSPFLKGRRVASSAGSSHRERQNATFAERSPKSPDYTGISEMVSFGIWRN